MGFNKIQLPPSLPSEMDLKRLLANLIGIKNAGMASKFLCPMKISLVMFWAMEFSMEGVKILVSMESKSFW